MKDAMARKAQLRADKRAERIANDGWVPVADEHATIIEAGLFAGSQLRRRCPKCGLVSPIWRHKAPVYGRCPECHEPGRFGGWVMVERPAEGATGDSPAAAG